MSSTPTRKLVARLSDLLAATPPTPTAKYLILVQTGDYNPPHKLHTQLFSRAREHIEAAFASHHVIAGYLSPRDDATVTSKLGIEAIPSYHRLPMARLAIRSSDWLDVASDRSEDFPAVALSLQTLIRDANWKTFGIDERQVEVWYLAGPEVFLGAGIKELLKWHIRPVCIFVPDPDQPVSYDDFKRGVLETHGQDSPIVVVEGKGGRTQLESFSSATVRKALARNVDVDSMVDPAVARYLKENGLQGGT
jgi:nicotinic acid mononucleotide adenylyltransferase